VTWRVPFESTHAIHVSTVLNRRSSRVRSGSAMSSRNASFVADWFGANRAPSGGEHQAHAGSAEVCHPTPGPTLAGVRIPDDRRRPVVRDPDRVDGAASSECCTGRVEGGIGHLAGVELDERGSRRRRQHLSVVHVVDARVGTNDRRAHSARSDVDDEDAHGAGSPLTRRAPPRAASGLR
jgi:hypothetical protein